MTLDGPARQRPFAAGSGRRPLPFVLGSLLILSFWIASAGRVSARSLDPAPPARAGLSTGTTLAVARATGASLYDISGKLVLDLPGGTALKVSGRTADNRWFYGATKDGTAGWVSAAGVVIFGVSNVPERAGFTEPTPAGVAAAGPAAGETAGAGPADAAAVATVSAAQPASVASGAERLNVRSGPGTTYPVIGSVATGTQMTASARDAAADWIQVEGTTFSGGTGWVSARYLTLAGSALDLSIASSTNSPLGAGLPPAQVAGLTGKLVFQERSGGKIYVYDLAGGVLRALTTGSDPAVSQDGRTVAFWREDGGDQGLYLIDIGGANERRILKRGELVRAPAWSPDDSKIVFSHINGVHRCRDVGDNVCMPDTFPYNLMFPLKITDAWGLARVDRDGRSYQDLAVMTDAISPNWSVRGIYYSGSGIQVTQDVSDHSQNHVVLSEYRYQDPAVQPGGDRIVFHTLEKDHWEIFAANADGSAVRALTRPATTLVTPLPHNVAPAWSPDGLHIVFLSNRTGRWQLWVMDADGGNQHALPLDVSIEYHYQAEQVVSWGQVDWWIGGPGRKGTEMLQPKGNLIRSRLGELVLMLIVATALGGCSAERSSHTVGPSAAPAAATPLPTPSPIVVSTPSDTLTSSTAASGSGATRRLAGANLTYNGEIMAEAIVPVVAQVSGQIQEVKVAVGDSVKKGDLLVRIDSTVAEAQRAQAQGALELAQSQVELAKTQPKQTDLDAAQAAVSAARAAYDRALGGATDEEKRMALAQVRQAEAAVSVYQSQYDRIASNPYAGMMLESLQLQQATLAKEAAQAQYDKVLKGATADQIANAYAALTGAQAQLAKLQRGAEPAQIKAAEAGAKQAEAAVYLAQLQLDKTNVEAPVDGFIYKLDAVEGGMAGQGTPLAVIYAHDMKIVIQVEETRFESVSLGQPVVIRVDAYGDRSFDGKVAEIAPTFDYATRTVQVTVRPTGKGAADFEPGMFATVMLMEQ